MENLDTTEVTDAHEGQAPEEVEATGVDLGSDGVVAGTDAVVAGLPACEFEDSQNCVWDAENSGNGEGNSFVDIDGTAYYFDYIDVYANDGFSVDCTTRETTHWFEQKVMGFKNEEDGTVTMIDLGYKAERYEEVLPSSDDEYTGRCELPEALPITTPPVLDSVEEVVVTAPVVVDAAPTELAATGGLDMLMPILVGSVLLLGGAAMLVRKKFTPKA